MEAGEILLKRGLLDERQLALVRSRQVEGTRIDQTAVELGFVSEEAALRAVGEEVGLDFIDLAEAKIDLSLLSSFPAQADPSAVAVSHPPPQRLAGRRHERSVRSLSARRAERRHRPDASSRCWPPRSEIAKLIKTHLGVGSETVDGLMAAAADDDGVELLEEIETDGSELSEMAQEASVVRLVNEILLEAIELRASDVHIESQEHGLQGPLPHRRHAAAAAACRRRSTAFRRRSSAA